MTGGAGNPARQGQQVTIGAGALLSQESQGVTGRDGGTLRSQEIIGDVERIQISDPKRLYQRADHGSMSGTMDLTNGE